MGKPLKGNPILTGRAAKEMLQYLAAAKPDAEKQEKSQADLEFHRKVKVDR